MRTTKPARPGSKLDLADAWLALLLLLILLLPGCATPAVWSEMPDRDHGRIDWSGGGTIAAVAVTPLALAADVALLAAVACALPAGASLRLDHSPPTDERARLKAALDQ